jgi:hypothetical protein
VKAIILFLRLPGILALVSPLLMPFGYVPGESDSGMFGGNSNWRGPISMPVNAIIIRALLQYYAYYGDDFTVECPTGSGQRMTLYEIAAEITRRLASMFLRDKDGRRPIHGGAQKFQHDPHWRDCLQFHEYFHGDTGAGKLLPKSRPATAGSADAAPGRTVRGLSALSNLVLVRDIGERRNGLSATTPDLLGDALGLLGRRHIGTRPSHREGNRATDP